MQRRRPRPNYFRFPPNPRAQKGAKADGSAAQNHRHASVNNVVENTLANQRLGVGALHVPRRALAHHQAAAVVGHQRTHILQGSHLRARK